MSHYTVPVMAAVLLLVAVQVGSAELSFSGLTSGKMSASFNSGVEGLSISYGGVAIVRDSSMWVHNSAWTFHYYGLPHMKDAVQIKDIDGGKEAVLTHRSSWFDGQQRIVVKEHSVTVELKYKLIQKADDADMEYCYGKVCAAPILGRPFKAVMGSGAIKDGVVPIQATSSDLDKSMLTPEPFKKLEIDSRIGRVIFEVSGDPDSESMIDYRLNQYEPMDKPPIFWLGVLGTHLEYGKEYTHTVTLTVEPAAVRSTDAAKARPGHAVALEKEDLRNPSSSPVYVIPEPREMKLANGDFAMDSDTAIVVGDSAKPEDLRGAKLFAEEVKLLYGLEPRVIREAEVAGDEGQILVGEAAGNRLLATAAREEAISAPDKDEGYALKVTPKRVLVLGHDRTGSYYGMQTLKQLVKASPREVAIQGCVINDWPSLKFRGVHLFTGNRALPFHKKLIDRIFSRFKMNSLVLEVDQIKWKSDPGLAVGFSEDQEDVKTEIGYAREHFIEVTPLLQSLGHCDWMFTNGKNRDMAENSEKPYSYCPLSPKVFPYVSKFYDEVVELFDKPRFVHIGHDEVMEPGGFPRHVECMRQSAEQIFAADVLKWHDYLGKSGARIMMWGDMMLYKGDAPDAVNAKSADKAQWIRDQVPKDVAITDWHYEAHKPETFKSIGIFTKEGHDTIASTWFTPANIEAFSKQAKAVGAYGLLQTTWAGFNSNEDNLRENFVQFSSMVLAAEYAWNSGKTGLGSLPYKWDEEFRRQWDPKPVDRTARKGFVLDLSSAYNVSLSDNEKKTGWLGLGAPNDLSALPTGEARLGGDLFHMAVDNAKPSAIRLASSLDMAKAYPEKAEISVGKKALSLLVLHTCAWADANGRDIGTYRVHYADGSIEEIPLTYGVNTCSWIDQRSLNGATRAWEGRTKDGQRAMLRKLQWDNPHPDKVIRSIEVVSARTEAGPVLVAISGLE